MPNPGRRSKSAKTEAPASSVKWGERPKATRSTLKVLEAFLEDPTEERHGFDLLGPTGLKSGSLYPILIRLHKHGLLQRRWEGKDGPGARRRLYMLTAEGEPVARRLVAEAKAKAAAPRVGHLPAPCPAGEGLA